MADQFALIPFAWCQASPGTSLKYQQVVLWCRLTMTIFWPYVAILVKNIVFFTNFGVWNWFSCTRKVQKYYRKQHGKKLVKEGYPGKNKPEIFTIFSHILNVVKTPTSTQHNGWVWHENDCANHPTPKETFQALLDELESWNLAQTLTRPSWLR